MQGLNVMHTIFRPRSTSGCWLAVLGIKSPPFTGRARMGKFDTLFRPDNKPMEHVQANLISKAFEEPLTDNLHRHKASIQVSNRI